MKRIKNFKIYTLGCKTNQYDSQLMREQLAGCGLQELNNEEHADCCIINTCTVTHSADRQARNLIRSAIRKNPHATIVATGCYAHANPEEIKKIDGVNLVLDNEKRASIAYHLFGSSKACSGITYFKGRTRAFVKVQDGCDNFCSFCKVPYVRGRSRSREIQPIIHEVKALSRKGYKEIVLTGICLGDYGKDFKEKTDVVDLVTMLEEIEGIERIRLSSIEAQDVTSRLIQKMKNSPKFCPHLHIPFQSGDDEILKKMNRKSTRKENIDLVKRIRRSVADVAITTDIIIGFPGEGKQHFNNTLSFLKEIEPSRTHVFPFSLRDKSHLSKSALTDVILPAIIKERCAELKKTTDSLSRHFKKRFIGKTLHVLFEEKKQGFWSGYSPNYLLVGSKSRKKIAQKIHPVKINKIEENMLFGSSY